MNIYSIKEIVKATNNFLKPEVKNTIKKNTKIKKKVPIILENKIPDPKTINSFNYKINIKSEIKDLMINELYIYLKKKIKKNTLKLIIDEQLEIKNLKNKINFLKKNENQIKIDYQILKNNYESILKDNEIIKTNNYFLQNNLNKVEISKKQLNNEIYELKDNLNKINLDLAESLGKNRSFEINNNEMKNTLSRYIINNKSLQEKINLIKSEKDSKFGDEVKKVRFYQDENVRLSSDLLYAQKNNEKIIENLKNIEIEKLKISNKINELNNSIDLKSNIVSAPFLKEQYVDAKNNIDELKNTDKNKLDVIIDKIFSKI